MYKPSDVAYLKTSHLNKISLILGIEYGLYFKGSFKYIKLLRKSTRFIFSLLF